MGDEYDSSVDVFDVDTSSDSSADYSVDTPSNDYSDSINDFSEDTSSDDYGEIADDIPDEITEDTYDDSTTDIDEDTLDVPEDIEEDISSVSSEDTTEDIPEDISEDTEEEIVEDNQESIDDSFDDISEDIESDETEVEVSSDIPEDIEEDVEPEVTDELVEEADVVDETDDVEPTDDLTEQETEAVDETAEVETTDELAEEETEVVDDTAAEAETTEVLAEETEIVDETAELKPTDELTEEGTAVIDETVEVETTDEFTEGEVEVVDKTAESNYDLSVFDKNGNLKPMNNEEYLSLTPEQQDLFEEKYSSLSQEEREKYDLQYAQADFDNYNKNVKQGNYERDESIEQDLNDIIAGKYMENDSLDSIVTEYTSKGIATILSSKIDLDPVTKSNLTNQAGQIGSLYGPQIMESITQTARTQYGSPVPTPIVHLDAFGNKSYDYGIKPSDKKPDWDNRILDCIDGQDQMDIYKNANLKQAEINDRPCLIKDIDYNFVDTKTGMTNRELMAKGRSPIDVNTNEKIELHHMGQKFDSPFAELTENSEHGNGNHKILHPKTSDSWRNDDSLKYEYQKEKSKHWIERSKSYNL